MEDYNPRDEERIASAITFINSHLLRSQSISDLNEEVIQTAYQVCSHAMNYFRQLTELTQLSLNKVKEDIHDQLSDQEYQQFLASHQDLKSVQSRLYQIFYTQVCKEHAQPPNSPEEFIEIEEVRTQEIIASYTKNKSDTPLSKKEMEGKKQQIKFVKDFGRRFMRDYYPVIIQGTAPSPTDSFQQHALNEFMTTFPEAIPHFLFHAPKVVEQHEKDLILRVLEQFTTFFQLYNLSIEGIKNKDKHFDTRRLEDKETLILSMMRSISIENNLVSFIPATFDENEMMITLSNILKKIILQYYFLDDPGCEDTSKALQKCLAATIPIVVIPLIFKRILSPQFFRVLFDNLLLRDISLPSDFVESPDFKDCDASDLLFTKEVGEIAQQLTQEILKFGEAKGILRGLGLITTKDSLGELIQKGINHVMGTDTCFIPISLLDHLLYHNGRPTLIEAYNAESQESSSSVEMDVKSRIYKILMKKMPSFFAWATDNLTSLDSFCETLSLRIFELTQSKKLFILFSCYFLEGIRLGLSTPIVEEK